VAKTATKPSQGQLQKQSLDGCTIDMPHRELPSVGVHRFFARDALFTFTTYALPVRKPEKKPSENTCMIAPPYEV